MTEPAPSGDFWHCARCGTPNPVRGYLTHCLGCGAARIGGPAARAAPARPRGRAVGVATWAYAALVLAILAMIRWVGHGWWGVVPLLFLPRWLFLVPVLVLALASGWARRPTHWAMHAATALVVAGPLMGFSLPL